MKAYLSHTYKPLPEQQEDTSKTEQEEQTEHTTQTTNLSPNTPYKIITWDKSFVCTITTNIRFLSENIEHTTIINNLNTLEEIIYNKWEELINTLQSVNTKHNLKDNIHFQYNTIIENITDHHWKGGDRNQWSQSEFFKYSHKGYIKLSLYPNIQKEEYYLTTSENNLNIEQFLLEYTSNLYKELILLSNTPISKHKDFNSLYNQETNSIEKTYYFN